MDRPIYSCLFPTECRTAIDWCRFLTHHIFLSCLCVLMVVKVSKVVEENIDETVSFAERAGKVLNKEIRVPRVFSPRRPDDLSSDVNNASSTVKAWYVIVMMMLLTMW